MHNRCLIIFAEDVRWNVNQMHMMKHSTIYSTSFHWIAPSSEYARLLCLFRTQDLKSEDTSNFHASLVTH